MAPSSAPRAHSGVSVWATFTPLVFNGLSWRQIAGPQHDPRAACLLVTAYIHLLRPEFRLRDLDALAQEAICQLEGGAATVCVIDECHRVDRAVLGGG